ncbi:MAG TPA: GNAT family N-acetyltransferase, partial [Elusimicrobiales bacterium]|nr:GNAT family N-acetyltransferase [Elusimicrobiales bacterium]
PDSSGSVEIGYGIAPRFRGNGYCAEALAALIAWCAQTTAIRRLTAQCRTDNIASLRVLEKCGFSRTSRELSEDGFPLYEFELLFSL